MLRGQCLALESRWAGVGEAGSREAVEEVPTASLMSDEGLVVAGRGMDRSFCGEAAETRD